jgi:hypothetical protein
MKAQIIKYKCCENVFAGCREPECYTSKDWLKSLKDYVNKGYIIDLVDVNSFKFDTCKCNKQLDNNKQLELKLQ